MPITWTVLGVLDFIQFGVFGLFIVASLLTRSPSTRYRVSSSRISRFI